MVLFGLDSFGDVASDQLNDEYFLGVSDLVGVVDDKGEAVLDDFLLRKDRSRLLCDYLPVVGIDGGGDIVH